MQKARRKNNKRAFFLQVKATQLEFQARKEEIVELLKDCKKVKAEMHLMLIEWKDTKKTMQT